MKKSWHINRRTFLRGTGVTLSLPFLECMNAEAAARPKRFCGVYFPYGVAMGNNDEDAKWRWSPKGEGKDYQFNESLKPLEAYRENLTVIGGLSHANGRIMARRNGGPGKQAGKTLES